MTDGDTGEGAPPGPDARACGDPGCVRILIVTGDPEILEFTRNDLQSHGSIMVETVRSAEEALEKLAVGRFDAIVSEIRLPRMGGIALLKTLRCQGVQAPVILITGGTEVREVMEAFNSGATAVLDTRTPGGLLPGGLCRVALRALEEQRTRQAFAREGAEYRDLVENAGSIIFRSDREGNITFFNEFGRKFFGFTAEEILGKNVIGTIVPASDSTGRDHVAMIHDIREHPEQYRNNENENIRKNGERVWISWTNRAVYDEKGEFLELLSVGNDITDRKKAGEALATANRKLNLLSSVTRHDVLNQLNVLAGYLGLVRDRVGDPDTAALLSRAWDSAWTIRKLIAFTKDYQEIGVNSPRWHNVADTVNGAASSIDLEGIVFSVEVGDLQVYADPLLEKVFYALLDNAVRHGERIGSIHVTARRDGKEMAITLEDDGIGVPDAEKQTIFARGSGKNTGYGLFIAREILSITGLAISETGTFGKGARFEIRVPEGAYRTGPGYLFAV